MPQRQKYALLSVYDKTDIETFAKALVKAGYEIISTGGTAKTLEKAKIRYTPIQDITGNPESFDGRMKTISFQIESALLYDRKNKNHLKQAKELDIKQVDIVACNLYPFERTIADKKVSYEQAIENIDVGGPTMIRSAAKNGLIVAIDPQDYPEIINSLKEKTFPKKLIRVLQAKAFSHLTFYDSQIAAYFRSQGEEQTFPDEITIPGRKLIDLRYGENPHQQGAVYIRPNTYTPLQELTKHWGRELSLINVTDINAGLDTVRMFTEPAAVVIKHNSPCGIALGKTIREALHNAIEADPESAFGGIIVLNKTLDLATAKVIGGFKDAKRGNMDIVSAPEITNDALAFLQKVRKSMGIYTFGKIPNDSDQWNLKSIDGGFVLQTSDISIDESFKQWKIVTKKKPTKEQLRQMHIGWKFATKIRSNTILVMDKEIPMTRGIGSGQTSRIRSSKIAIEQSSDHIKDAILVSDSFFPFPDTIELAAEYGVGAIVQQGGSMNDQLSIDAANKAGVPMIFTGRRAFWH